MPSFRRPPAHWGYLLPGLPALLAACTLTTAEVEPALPDGRVNGASLLAYLADGQPVVANNDSGLGALFGSFFGYPPVYAGLAGDSTLTIDASDDNQPTGYAHHHLVVQIKRFRGAGTYAAVVGSPTSYDGSYYEVYPADKSGSYTTAAGPRQLLVSGGRRQVIITSWEPTTGSLVGTFELDVAAPQQPQLVTQLRAGRFDLSVQ